jgi:hypothetical protein
MIEAHLIREPVNDGQTEILGWMRIEGETIYTLERPWVNNQRSISCIPPGEYIVSYLHRSSSGKYRRVYHVQNVPNRLGILIHQGNVEAHTRGCIIVGTSHGVLKGKRAVLSSAVGLQKLRSIVGENTFKLVINHV